MTRQRKYQIKMIELGQCQICGSPLTTRNYCKLHAEYHNTWQRNKQRAKRGIPLAAALNSIYRGKPTKSYLASLEEED